MFLNCIIPIPISFVDWCQQMVLYHDIDRHFNGIKIREEGISRLLIIAKICNGYLKTKSINHCCNQMLCEKSSIHSLSITFSTFFILHYFHIHIIYVKRPLLLIFIHIMIEKNKWKKILKFVNWIRMLNTFLTLLKDDFSKCFNV